MAIWCTVVAVVIICEICRPFGLHTIIYVTTGYNVGSRQFMYSIMITEAKFSFQSCIQL